MRKVVLFTILVMFFVPYAANAVDVSPLIAVDLGVPVLYVNKNPLGDVSTIGGNPPLWGLILGNLRSGIEADLVFKIVPDVFGLGVNTALLIGIGSQPGTDGLPTFIADLPLRALARFNIPAIAGYIQLNGGIVLENIFTAPLTPGFNVLRHLDIGLRVKFFQVAIEGGYLVKVAELSKTSNILRDSSAPFYLGMYFSIL